MSWRVVVVSSNAKVDFKMELSALLEEAQEEMAEENIKLSCSIQEYLGKLALLADYPVTYEQGDNLSALIKAMSFQIDLEGLPLIEALNEHISLYRRLNKDQCFVLVHAKACFTSEELVQLYGLASYKKWNLLLLESHQYEERLQPEQHRLFDRDLCELMLDSLKDMS